MYKMIVKEIGRILNAVRGGLVVPGDAAELKFGIQDRAITCEGNCRQTAHVRVRQQKKELL